MSHITETDLASLTDSDLFVSLNNKVTYTTKSYPLAEVEAAGEELKTLIAKHTITDFAQMGWQILKDGRWVALLPYDTSSLIDAMQQYLKAQKWLAKHAEGVRFYAELAN